MNSVSTGLNDQGQISKVMLSRLEGQGLVENTCGMNTTSPRKGTRMSKARDRLTSLLAKTGLFAMVCGLLCIVGSGASLVLPASAGAYATIEGPPKFSAAPGLPDGGVYEQVSMRIRMATRRVVSKHWEVQQPT